MRSETVSAMDGRGIPVERGIGYDGVQVFLSPSLKTHKTNAKKVVNFLTGIKHQPVSS